MNPPPDTAAPARTDAASIHFALESPYFLQERPFYNRGKIGGVITL